VKLLRLLAVPVVVVALLACAGPAATPTPAPTAPPTAPPTAAPTATPTAAPTAPPTEPPTEPPTAPPTATPDACAPANLALINPPRLTLSTDIPAFPPWWGGDAAEQYPNEPEGGSPWSETEFSAEPYSGEGFEGALAYAVAAAMGFDASEVDWIANPVFEQAFAPGDKPFDFHMAQISATEERASAVTFSDPYFLSNQSVLALTGNPITAVTSIEGLKAFRLGAAQATTSFALIEDIIQPAVEPRVYPDNAAALAALSAGGDDAPAGIVVDLSTAFYMRDAELEDFDTPDPEGTIVGQFGPPAEPDHVAYVLELGNPLVACVNQALAQVMADGTHAQILDVWINTGQDVPFLE
jgi:polar amino acid transport system substrate-binding protein